ncbi:MAG: thiamine-phosphate kinase [Chloroflexi bacterium]|nr:thiamine-phosphate kinase [Chloroflexota bacterium]MYK33592.1 thiamine-phosphate kinase [Chloroflexota bacterium]
MTTVGELGETALIERIVERVRRASPLQTMGGRVITAIGDDAAAWRVAGVQAATTDTMVEGVHFRTSTASWADVGWKVWVSNVSDIAAMGGSPFAGLVTLGLPADLDVSNVDALYDGVLEACAVYGTELMGGDIVGSPVPFVTIAMTGVCSATPLSRSAARPGDALAVTGPLGGSRGGLLLLESGAELDTPARQALALAHRRPAARTDAGVVLRRVGVRCAMDLSDGLAADLPKLTKASGVAARVEIEHVPVADALRSEFRPDALRMALGGGEDYELLFTGPSDLVQAAVSEVPGSAVIGEITEGPVGRISFVAGRGEPVSIEVEGWEHLR